MSDFDLQNLHFLLSISQAELLEWYNNTESHNHDYALDLFSRYSKELDLRDTLMTDAIDDTSDATRILAQFTLGRG